MSRCRAFLDTEFTDFLDCELISIGIVTDDGREFYGERIDYDDSTCSAFVREAVLPKLGKEPAIVGTAAELRTALLEWFAELGPVEIYIDSQTDWDLLIDLCYELPSTVRSRNGLFDEREIERYWRENGYQAHHALHDARANRFSFIPPPAD